MGKLYKQFAESVTKWKADLKSDEFFIARIRLTFYYSITAIIILGGSSIVLYNMILSNLTESISQNIFLDPRIGQAIIDKAQDILLNRFISIDSAIIFFIIILGFLLTNKTLEPIESNMQKQKRFVADASHELRTPIAVVISGLEVNLNNKNLDLASAKKTLENTLEEMREFSKLSNNLLDLSKYDRAVEVEYENINISLLVNDIVEKNKSLAIVKNINIENKISSNASVKGNKIELSRVFFNILDNAIKYTKDSGTISISDKVTSNKYIVNINDNGVGIREDILNKIFDPFFRGDASRHTNGAGLGLTLSKKIIENHKGTIVIKSQVNKGTNVIISLPISS
ncbi:HAMP domain-containing histidine kinase [Candidatus Nomurabacteria bacterium]|nr:HAMP domain-containing histidine kinase [Candidatus Nomurabacteria bacterium]